MTHTIIDVPNATVVHPFWSNIGILSRAFLWGYSGTYVARRHPKHTRRRCPSDVEFTLLLLLAWPLLRLLSRSGQQPLATVGKNVSKTGSGFGDEHTLGHLGNLMMTLMHDDSDATSSTPSLYQLTILHVLLSQFLCHYAWPWACGCIVCVMGWGPVCLSL